MFKTLTGSVACFLRSKRGGFCGILLAGLLFSGAFQAVAEEDLQTTLKNFKLSIRQSNLNDGHQELTLDGVKYSKDNIVWDFANLVINSQLWLESSFKPTDALEAIKSLNKEADQESWLSEYTSRRNGLPKSAVVNKWQGNVAVAIGWPKYQTDFLNEHFRGEKTPKEQSLFIEKVIRNVIPEMQRETGISVSFLSENDNSESTKDFAKIRIIPVTYSPVKNKYKFLSRYPSEIKGHNAEIGILSNLVGAVAFTPNSSSQVDGFILPNHTNGIGMVVCRVWLDLNQSLLSSLLTECLLRATGITNLSTNTKSLLGNWNASEKEISKMPAVDGLQAFLYPGVKYETVPPETDFMRSVQEFGLTEYDRLMVRLLYCPDIKVGMDKLQVIKTLYATNTCWKKIEGNN